jgi:hypothetical protein
MSRELQIGDRVQTTQWYRQKRYHTGDRGTVMQTVKLDCSPKSGSPALVVIGHASSPVFAPVHQPFRQHAILWSAAVGSLLVHTSTA